MDKHPCTVEILRAVRKGICQRRNNIWKARLIAIYDVRGEHGRHGKSGRSRLGKRGAHGGQVLRKRKKNRGKVSECAFPFGMESQYRGNRSESELSCYVGGSKAYKVRTRVYIARSKGLCWRDSAFSSGVERHVQADAGQQLQTYTCISFAGKGYLLEVPRI